MLSDISWGHEMVEMRYLSEADAMVVMYVNAEGTTVYEHGKECVSWVEREYLPEDDAKMLEELEAKLLSDSRKLEQFLRSRANEWERLRQERACWAEAA